jgi:hypothetical protein
MAKVSEMKEMMASLLEGLNDTANKNNEKLCTQLEIVAEKLDSNGLRIDELTRAVGAGRMVQKVQIKGSKTGKKSSGEETVDGKDNGDIASFLETEGDNSGTGQNYQVTLHEHFVSEGTDAVKQAFNDEELVFSDADQSVSSGKVKAMCFQTAGLNGCSEIVSKSELDWQTKAGEDLHAAIMQNNSIIGYFLSMEDDEGKSNDAQR